MARTIYWRFGVAGLWTDPDKWRDANGNRTGVPQPEDSVILDASGVGSIVIPASTEVKVRSITMEVGYTGRIVLSSNSTLQLAGGASAFSGTGAIISNGPGAALWARGGTVSYKVPLLGNLTGNLLEVAISDGSVFTIDSDTNNVGASFSVASQPASHACPSATTGTLTIEQVTGTLTFSNLATVTTYQGATVNLSTTIAGIRLFGIGGTIVLGASTAISGTAHITKRPDSLFSCTLQSNSPTGHVVWTGNITIDGGTLDLMATANADIPENSHSLDVTGNVVFAAGSTFKCSTNGSLVASTQTRLTATGSITIAASCTLVYWTLAAAPSGVHSHVVLSGNSLTGDFDFIQNALTRPLPDNADWDIDVDATSLALGGTVP